ncbi:glycosyltransferase family 4 protein [Azohydromonas caseinilytica]|uniref:Glycosyltransferase family 4 protein n=1 Tax=Azohydromonas caseinilytica TaxID=2728836 RepID=A0A848F8R4_9BURK|nr:glycosyltransferase family 4 protein [Azohydromonas caseinilytica]NML15085.1 glycosyltransferase family 4 protein [Azohydromonas caseinilytica]
MRVAVVSNTAWYLFNFRLNLMRALQADGHEVVAVAPADAYAERLRAAGIGFEPVPISGGGTNPLVELQSVRRLRGVLRRRGVELVLSYTPKGNLYSALAGLSCGVPFVPNVSGLGRAFIRRSPVTLVAQALYRLTFGRALRVFFQNNDDLNVFVHAGLARAEQCERLPGSGVDLRRFTPAPLPQRPADAPVFLLVARLMWDKGVGEYVEAARRVRQRHPQARFRLLGFVDVANPSAVPRAQVERWEAEGLVEYLGPTDDVRPFLAEADCVVLPSYREGVPRTLLEAAAMARPIVTTDAPGCRDTVIDGQSGLLCRPADAADLGDKLLRFIDLAPQARQAMGHAGRALMERSFSEQLVLDRYRQLVSDISAHRKTAQTAACSR